MKNNTYLELLKRSLTRGEQSQEALVDTYLDELTFFSVSSKINKAAKKVVVKAFYGCKKGPKDEGRKRRELICQMQGLQSALKIYKAGIGQCSKERNPEKCKAKVQRWINDCSSEIAKMKKLILR